MTKKNEEEKKLEVQNSISWKLKDLPSIEEIRQLVKDDLITKDEARSILFKEVNQEERIKTLEEQVAFYQDIVQRLLDREPVTTIVKHVYDYTPKYTGPYWISGTATSGGTATYKAFANNVVHTLSLSAPLSTAASSGTSTLNL